MGDRAALAAAGAWADDWVASFAAPLAGLDAEAAVTRALAGEGSQAWYDLAAGLRVYRLAYLLDLACRTPERGDQEIGRLADALSLHHRVLAQPRAFSGHNNHGVFQSLGQLAAARRLPELDPGGAYAALARARLQACLTAQFFDEGVHREHSPGYHQILLATLIGAREDGLLGAEVEALTARAETALGWMITPGGGLAPLGDTERKWYGVGPGFVGRFRDPAVRALLRRGRGAPAPPLGVQAYPEAGLAFARLAGADGRPAYLAQGAGFHSRVHKHADHLGFVWWDRGREVLADPGRFAYLGRTEPGSDLREAGFWYADPRRIYVESTRAHNALEIDGRDHPRRDGEAFGSALKGAREADGLAVTECAFTRGDGLAFRRVLVMAPGRYLLVVDEAVDPADAPHAARQWFTFAPEWRVARVATGFVAESATPPPERLTVLSLDGAALEGPWRGREEPDLLGWVAETPNRLTPASTVCFRREGTAASFATLFAFGDAEPAAAQALPAGAEAAYAWTQAGRPVQVVLSRDADGLRAREAGALA
nr:heparinase II/III family protein [Caulobacter sp. 17J80-11]